MVAIKFLETITTLLVSHPNTFALSIHKRLHLVTPIYTNMQYHYHQLHQL